MDRMIYTAMSGAKHTMEQQATASNNLANATTTGFREQLDTFRSVPVVGEGLSTRSFVVDSTSGSNFSGGPIQETGRALDVAVQGPGWFAVKTVDGGEAYTRNGNFKLNENGILQTQTGQNVAGEGGGTISVPPDSNVTIAPDGTVSSIPTTGAATAGSVLGRLKLVNPNEKSLTRGNDGLFRLTSGTQADADANVRVIGSALEGSNVNVVESMVSMINLARQFDLNMKLVQTAESNTDKANQILSLS